MSVPAHLAPWASWPQRSRGRRLAQPDDTGAAGLHRRNIHQRDRDRIVHCSAFRRLCYKTQVFINHEGDLFRTRLTHSLEVAQLARSMARTLRLGEDLVEAICLAHDLGHTPFGHAGQDALNACMAAHGGFEHNLQSLRVVDALEQRYPGFDGLNLSFETREGILKHCARSNAEWIEAREPAGVARRFLDGTQPGLEAQLCNLADEMAYNTHDIDDGVRAGLLSLEQALALPLFGPLLQDVRRAYPGLAVRRAVYEAMRRMLALQVEDLVRETSTRLAAAAPADEAAVRALARPLVGASAGLRRQALDLKRALFAQLYRHPQVCATTGRAAQVIRTLFGLYLDDPRRMPSDHAGAPERPRAVADYIAGMTDRLAVREFERLTGQPAFDAGAGAAPPPAA